MSVRLFVHRNARGQITLNLQTENAPSATIRTAPQKRRQRILWWEKVRGFDR